MESYVKNRYQFAMSAFSRMYGVDHVKSSTTISRFCMKWAETEDQNPPSGTLIDINFYFKDLWEIWGGYI
jgi:hypothetical protein|tara:strand:- start:84 stop:293 length:210 start_codon:yes stop_codon:yes gene_type:complete